MSYLTITPVDGPRAGTTRTVRDDRSTMSTMRLSDGTWVMYDRNPDDRAIVEVVHWRPTGEVIDGVVAVREVHRERYDGVL